MSLVTVEEVDNALRLDLAADIGGDPSGDTGDTSRLDDVILKIAQAEDIVLDFIQPKPDPAWTESTAPPRVKAAIIIAVRCLLDESEENTAILSGLAGGDVDPAKNTIAALLWRLRDPSLA